MKNNVPQFELESHFKVYDNENKEIIKIGTDRDGHGLDCVKIIDGDITLVMPPDQALLVAEAIKRVALELKDRS